MSRTYAFVSTRKGNPNTVIERMQYSIKDQVLRVNLNTSTISHYDYFDVSPEQAEGAFVAENPCQWWNEFKRLGHRYESTGYEAVI